ncbi:MAG: invasion associated locus B family protein [Rhodobacteraceae bacterium]|nr:invasion associated locus B family protein [Paracoccaceae bacterium]
MFRHLTSLSLAALMGLATPLSAQTDTGTATDTETSQLDLGTPVDGEPQLGERYAAQSFGDWELACIKTQAEKDPCSLLQILRDENDNPLAEISLFRLANAGQAVAGATIVVPLETLLTAQMTIAVDGGSAKRYNYSYCSPIGCVAQIGLTQADVDSFKRGAEGVLTIVPAPAPDQKVTARISLSGFTAGYDAVDVISN